MATWLWRERFRLTMPKFAPKDERDNAENMRAVERAVNALSIIPTGGIILWAYSDIPELFLELNGQAVSRGTYRDLFALWGTTFGIGDGSTTFNVPNIAGKVVVGLDTADTAFDAMGETGGAATATLTTTELPAHDHTIAHTHTVSATFINNDTSVTAHKHSTVGGVAEGVSPNDGTSAPVTSASSAANSGSAGTGSAFSILNPYITLKYIVKT